MSKTHQLCLNSLYYYYYKTKDEILAAVIAAVIAELMTAITFAVTRASAVEEKIKAFFRTKLEIILEKRIFFNSLDVGMDPAELSGFRKTKLTVHQQIMQQEGELLGQIISEAIGRGELARLGHKDQENLVFVLQSSLQGMKREMAIQNDFSNIVMTRPQ